MYAAALGAGLHDAEPRSGIARAGRAALVTATAKGSTGADVGSA